MDDGEVAHLPHHAQLREVVLVLPFQVVARPLHRALREWVEPDELGVQRGFLVVVALHHRALQLAHHLQALVRVRIVTDDVPDADEMRAVPVCRVLENSLETFEVRMDVSKNSNLHGLLSQSSLKIGGTLTPPVTEPLVAEGI